MPRGEILDLLPEKSGSKRYHVENWGPQHSLIATLRGAGLTVKKIAEVTGYDAGHISKVCGDPRARDQIIEAATKVVDNLPDLTLRMKFHATEALEEILDELRNCEKPEVRQRAAFGLLDRAGYSPVQKSIAASVQIPEKLVDRLERSLLEREEISASYEVIESGEPRTGDQPLELEQESLEQEIWEGRTQIPVLEEEKGVSTPLSPPLDR